MIKLIFLTTDGQTFVQNEKSFNRCEDARGASAHFEANLQFLFADKFAIRLLLPTSSVSEGVMKGVYSTIVGINYNIYVYLQ